MSDVAAAAQLSWTPCHSGNSPRTQDNAVSPHDFKAKIIFLFPEHPDLLV